MSSISAIPSVPLAIDPRALRSGVRPRRRALAPADAAPYAATGVGVVEVFGPLEHRGGWWSGTDYESLSAAVAEGLKTGGVVLRIDSPGGTCAGLDECCRRIRAAKAETGSPLVAYVDELAASAAYAIACEADMIVLPRSGEVGSIGVLGPLVDESAAVLSEGIKLDLVRSPSGKADAASVQPIHHLARERMTRAVADAYVRFAAQVTERRGIPREAIDALNGDLLEGERAIAARLADVLGSLEDAIELAGGSAAQAPTMGPQPQEPQPMALATRTRNAADTPAEPMPPEPEAPAEPEAPKASAIEVECPVAEGGCGERWLVDPSTGKVTGKPLGAPEGAHSAMAQLLELTGAKSPQLALGVVRSWRADSEVHRRTAIEERAKRENAEKVAALRAAVVAGSITPAMAWQDPEAEEPAPKGYWASLAPEALRSELAGYGAPTRTPHAPIPGATVMAGVDMTKWGDKAAQIAQIVNRAQRGGKAG